MWTMRTVNGNIMHGMLPQVLEKGDKDRQLASLLMPQSTSLIVEQTSLDAKYIELDVQVCGSAPLMTSCHGPWFDAHAVTW
jgi:hypothetical protein